jgi:hypothetical protein
MAGNSSRRSKGGAVGVVFDVLRVTVILEGKDKRTPGRPAPPSPSALIKMTTIIDR